MSVTNIVDDPSKTKEPETPEWKKIVGDKYESEAALAKAYKDLEKKLTEQGTELKSAKEFALVVNPILDEIRADKDIFDKLDKKLRDKANPDTKADETKPDLKVEELRASASDLIVARFEEKYGISQLSPEEKKTIRQKIGDEILDLTGQRLAGIDLRRLNGVLEKAYILATKDDAKSDKSDDTQFSGDDGAIGKMKSSQQKGESKLTPEEAIVAEKLGLSREQYLSAKSK